MNRTAAIARLAAVADMLGDGELRLVLDVAERMLLVPATSAADIRVARARAKRRAWEAAASRTPRDPGGSR